ncbi:MAG: hypothetical protein R2797_07780 [Gelidibacter sp.]
MKNSKVYVLCLVCVALIVSCSKTEETEPIISNSKDVTDCGITIEPNLGVSICLDGTDVASPNETIKFAASFYLRNSTPYNSGFIWTIDSGNMEIVDIEHSMDGLIRKSVATIKFHEDFDGNGHILVDAISADGGGGSTEHFVELETNQ